MEILYKEIFNIFESFISKVGFPIFIAVWVLIIQKKSTDRLTLAINHLTSLIEDYMINSLLKKKGGDE